jgi:anti-sigma B factor antagonist
MSTRQRRRHIEVKSIGDVTVINFVDRNILNEEIILIGEQLFILVDEQGHRKLLVNFCNVEYLAPATLGKLITLNQKLQRVSGKLVLCNIAPQIYELVELIKLNIFITITKDEPAGLQEFSNP